MRDRAEIEAEVKQATPTLSAPAVLWHEPTLKLVLEVLLDIRDQTRPSIGDCDACAGQPGTKDCMCGGTGRAADAVPYLRQRLLEAEKALAER